MDSGGRCRGPRTLPAANPSHVLIPKTRKEIWLNRVRVWLPPASVAVMAPVLIVFLLGQRYFVRGIALSGMKG